MSNGLRLSLWVRHQFATSPVTSGLPMTHLKLQKLCFYCYGIADGAGAAESLGDVTFEAWKHGPVESSVYHAFKLFGGQTIERPAAGDEAAVGGDWMKPDFGARAEAIMSDVVDVYGRLTAWELRELSHLEDPWKTTGLGASISREAIRKHFCQKFAAGHVAAPAYLFDPRSVEVDGLRSLPFESLHQLAEAARRATAAASLIQV